MFRKGNLELVDIVENDVVREDRPDRLEENDYENRTSNPVGADSFTYDLGSGPITSKIDSDFTWTVEVTRGNGTTYQQTLTFVQLENGAIFSNFPQTAFENTNVQSIWLVSHGSGNFFGTTVDRSLTTTQIVCFAESVRIQTPDGEIAVSELSAGDLVLTQDNGPQPIRWIGKRHLGRAELQANPNFLPVMIKAGALAESVPERDLRVSPQHRILIRSKIADRVHSSEEVLVAAKHLLDLPLVEREAVNSVTYYHLAFDRHEIVFADGTPVESFYPGKMAIAALDTEARYELFELCPELGMDQGVAIARTTLNGREGRELVRRHQKKCVPLVSAV